MIRPCFLVLDPEYGSSISTRKLVIESAKMNVITAYSARELLETLAVFPRVSSVILNRNTADMPCEDVVQAIKHLQPDLPVVIIGTADAAACDGADYALDTYDPARLLDLLRSIEPRKYQEIADRNEELSRNPDSARQGAST